MKKLLLLCIGAVFLTAATAVSAYPTLTGPTGTAALPTADIAPGGITVAADFYDTEGDSTIPARAIFGLGNWEIGGLFAFNDVEDIWGANAKVRVNIAGLTGLALGGLYTRGTDSDNDALSVYLVNTFHFGGDEEEGTGLRASIGANWTQVDLGAGDTDAIRGFASLGYTFDNRISIAAEYQTRDEDLGETDSLTSVVARIPVSKQVAAQVGYSNASPFGLFGTDSHNIFAGISFNFGAEAE